MKIIGKLVLTLLLSSAQVLSIRIQQCEKEKTFTFTYPQSLAPRGEETNVYHGHNGTLVTVQDPYRFLEDPLSNVTKSFKKAHLHSDTIAALPKKFIFAVRSFIAPFVNVTVEVNHKKKNQPKLS